MNMKEARRLKPGAIVREAWIGPGAAVRTGLVLTKEHVREAHYAKALGSRKDERYDVMVHWFDGPRLSAQSPNPSPNPEKLQNWQIMVISHA